MEASCLLIFLAVPSFFCIASQLFLCGILLTSALSQLHKEGKALKEWPHINLKKKKKELRVKALSDVLLHARCLPMVISK